MEVFPLTPWFQNSFWEQESFLTPLLLGSPEVFAEVPGLLVITVLWGFFLQVKMQTLSIGPFNFSHPKPDSYPVPVQSQPPCPL